MHIANTPYMCKVTFLFFVPSSVHTAPLWIKQELIPVIIIVPQTNTLFLYNQNYYLLSRDLVVAVCIKLYPFSGNDSHCVALYISYCRCTARAGENSWYLSATSRRPTVSLWSYSKPGICPRWTSPDSLVRTAVAFFLVFIFFCFLFLLFCRYSSCIRPFCFRHFRQL